MFFSFKSRECSLVRFSIGVFPTESKESTQKVVEAVQEAEAAGFDRAWIVDSQGLFRDVYVTLTLCAERTKRIGLGTAVTNSITRHLSVTARAVLEVAGDEEALPLHPRAVAPGRR